MKIFGWLTWDRSGRCDSPVWVTVAGVSLSEGLSLTRAAGFHGLKGGNRDTLPQWVVDEVSAHPGCVCWHSFGAAFVGEWQFAEPGHTGSGFASGRLRFLPEGEVG